jgi:hypothetical protein
LVHAVDDKINEQVAFVEWWDTDGPGAHYGGNKTKNALGRSWSVAMAHEKFGFDQQTVSRWRKWTSDTNQEKYRENLILGMRRRAGLEPDENHRAQGTGENEWFTPEEYLHAARLVLGNIAGGGRPGERSGSGREGGREAQGRLRFEEEMWCRPLGGHGK